MNIFYREQGQGTPVILIHGFCETHEVWSGFDTKLSEWARVITIDLPGFGKSPFPEYPFTLDSLADELLRWLKDKQINIPVLVGHSLGGYVVLAMAAKDPEYCQKIVLFHSTIYADTPEKRLNRDKVIDFVSRNGVAPFIETFVPSLFYNKQHPDIDRVKSICASTPPGTLIAYAKAMRDRPSRAEFFHGYTGKSLVIAGEGDEIIPLEVSVKMAKEGRDLEFLSLPATGHMGFIEAPQATLEKITSVIDS